MSRKYNKSSSDRTLENIPMRLVAFDRVHLVSSITFVVHERHTADGKELATYKGKIDLSTNDGGYVKFDLNGKRYIYYNCFVESIADIK